MKCPVCFNPLRSHRSLNTSLKVCPACRGIWFDRGALPVYVKALSQRESIKPTKTQLFEPRQVNRQPEAAIGRTCPCCDVTMHVRNYAYDSNVFVDQCPTCEGVWTDHREVVRIARHVKPDPRTAAVGQALAENVHDSQKLLDLDPSGYQARTGWLRFLFLPKFVLPLKDDECCNVIPWVTISLITLCCAVFAGQLFWVEDSLAFVQRFAFIPAQFWSLGLVTSMFLHGGIFHLLGNMLFLWLFGDNVEEHLGWWRFIALYVTCELTSALCHSLANPGSTVPCVGASGAIAGVMGAYAIFFPRARIKTYVWGFILEIPAVFYLVGWFGMQILSGLIAAESEGGGIAWFAHIGGFGCGLAWAGIHVLVTRRSSR